jgi:hypothetical protein
MIADEVIEIVTRSTLHQQFHFTIDMSRHSVGVWAYQRTCATRRVLAAQYEGITVLVKTL